MTGMTTFPLHPPSPPPLRGDEPVQGTDATVLDFWQFALSDFKMNNVRGYLAEFLVARAIGAAGPRVEWDAYDVVAPDGTTIEVKASAYLQSWEQRTTSRITFSGLKKRVWDTATGMSEEPTYNAEIYVFAVQTALTHEEYDLLSVSQWQFYVMSRPALQEIGYASIGLSTLRRHAGPAVTYSELADTIQSASARVRPGN